MLIYAITKVYAGASSTDPNGDMELNFLITTNCQNAPYSSIEEAQAAVQAGYIETSWEFYQEQQNFLSALLLEQKEEADIYQQWGIQLPFKN